VLGKQITAPSEPHLHMYFHVTGSILPATFDIALRLSCVTFTRWPERERKKNDLRLLGLFSIPMCSCRAFRISNQSNMARTTSSASGFFVRGMMHQTRTATLCSPVYDIS